MLLLLLILGLYFLIKWKKMSHTNEDDTELLLAHNGPITFAYNDLRIATDNFNSANILGKGGCGVVFKGQVREQAMDSELNWQARFNICLGFAKGLSYLHEERPTPMIHRDIKPGNILLDANLNPKIADFGLARLQAEVADTRRSFGGTLGYAGPEYVMKGELSIKTDIYAFGVVALEIISGRRQFEGNLEPGKQSLLNWARTLHHQEKHELLQLVDSRLSGFDEDQVRRVIKVALLCTQEDEGSRPLMSSVIKILLGETDVKSAAISSQGAASTSGASTMDDLLPATWAYLKNLNNEGQE